MLKITDFGTHCTMHPITATPTVSISLFALKRITMCSKICAAHKKNCLLIWQKMIKSKRLFNVSESFNCLEIWRACRDGDLDQVRILIREGQQPNEQSQKFKNTPLHIAAKHGHVLIVKFLLSQGA